MDPFHHGEVCSTEGSLVRPSMAGRTGSGTVVPPAAPLPSSRNTTLGVTFYTGKSTR